MGQVIPRIAPKKVWHKAPAVERMEEQAIREKIA